MRGGDAEERKKGGVPPTAVIEAEDELVEIGLEMMAAQPVVDTQRPDIELGENTVNSWQVFVSSRHADDIGIVVGAESEATARPLVDLGGGARREVGGQEGLQADRRVVGQNAQADAAEPQVLHLDGADNHCLFLFAASAGPRVVPAAPSDFGLVDLDQAGERGWVWYNHADRKSVV